MCPAFIDLKEKWQKAQKAIQGFHIHIYFEEKNQNENHRAEAMSLAQKLKHLFPDAVQDITAIGAVGPHAKPNIAVEIKPKHYGEIVHFLQMAMKEFEEGKISILIHPETGDVKADHLQSALWLGQPIGFKSSFFNRFKR